MSEEEIQVGDYVAYMMEQERAFRGEEVVRFLKHLMRQVEGKLLIVWDGFSTPSRRGGQGLPRQRGILATAAGATTWLRTRSQFR